MAFHLDSFDKAILTVLQDDNRQSYTDIGTKVGLSESAVRRRIKVIRKHGIIRGDVSIIEPMSVGLTVIVLVRMAVESPETYSALKAKINASDRVSQCYTVCGENDFVLVGHFDDAKSFERWALDTLLPDETVERYTSHIVTDRAKFSTAVPL